MALQVKKCFVSEIGIFGHSHGGGSTYNLADRLNDRRGAIGGFTIPFKSYVDAIKENSINAETVSYTHLTLPTTPYV